MMWLSAKGYAAHTYPPKDAPAELVTSRTPKDSAYWYKEVMESNGKTLAINNGRWVRSSRWQQELSSNIIK